MYIHFFIDGKIIKKSFNMSLEMARIIIKKFKELNPGIIVD